jgi:transposase
MGGKSKRIDNSGQLGLFWGGKGKRLQGKKGAPGVKFEDPQPEGILIGKRSLREFLEETGQTEVFQIRGLLREVVGERIESGYRGGGRRPYHPASMLGLVLWGLMEGKTSLRQLEKLSRSDVRCWWLTGGIFPDHSVIGRFLNQHAGAWTEEFFEELTRRVLEELAGRGGVVAVDGTLVQAAASRYRRVRREAAEQAAREARARAQQQPDDKRLRQQAEQAEEVARVVKERVRARQAQRKDSSRIAVSPSEPEAVIQPLKEKHTAPAYRPSIVANPDRVIVAQAVDPKSETAVVKALLQQVQRTWGPVRQLLADPGYHSIGVMRECRQQGVQDLLCPESPQGERRSVNGLFPKNRFDYHPAGDYYRCPAGEKLIGFGAGRHGQQVYRSYGKAPCGACRLRAQCTRAVRGRILKRFGGDEYKEKGRQVMREPRAQQQYRRRKGMVEPVFGELKHLQGLQRFRRRGLAKVRLEFSLHAMAHNLRRLLARGSCPGPVFSSLGRLGVILGQLWGSPSSFTSPSLVGNQGIVIPAVCHTCPTAP